MAEHPIHNLMKISMENIKQMVDVDTIVGNPVKTENGETIIPVSKVSFGFAAGGSEFEAERKTSSNDQPPFGGGSGGGVSITPIAFLVVNQSGVELKHIEERTSLYAVSYTHLDVYKRQEYKKSAEVVVVKRVSEN